MFSLLSSWLISIEEEFMKLFQTVKFNSNINVTLL